MADHPWATLPDRLIEPFYLRKYRHRRQRPNKFFGFLRHIEPGLKISDRFPR